MVTDWTLNFMKQNKMPPSPSILQPLGDGHGGGAAAGRGTRTGCGFGRGMSNDFMGALYLDDGTGYGNGQDQIKIYNYEIKEVQHERKDTELRVRNGKR